MICYTEVKFLGKNGYDHELKEAKKLLKVGKIYTIYRIEIGSWHTNIWLIGFDKPFNSVMFEGVGTKI